MELNVKLKSTIKLKKREPLSRVIRRGYRALYWVIGIGIFVLGASYMWITSIGQQKGYQLNQEQGEIETLEMMNRDLEKEVVKARSLNNIQERAVVEGMGDEYEVKYVKDGRTVSVKRGD